MLPWIRTLVFSAPLGVVLSIALGVFQLFVIVRPRDLVWLRTPAVVVLAFIISIAAPAALALCLGAAKLARPSHATAVGLGVVVPSALISIAVLFWLFVVVAAALDSWLMTVLGLFGVIQVVLLGILPALAGTAIATLSAYGALHVASGAGGASRVLRTA